MSLKNQVVWITGASSGIGEALALHLSEKGHRLVLSARREEALAAVRERCANPEKAGILPLDLARPETFGEKVREATAFFGLPDILVNNAGVSQRSLIADTALEVYRDLMEINYLGTVGLSKAILPEFVQRGGGRFVTVTSLMGKFGSPLRSGYCGAKHALHGFFDVLRMEHENQGIGVTMICPGFVRTQIARNALTGDGSPQGRDDQATQEGISPEACARRMWRAVEKDKWEAYVGGREVLGVYLKRLSQKLLHRTVARSRVV
ncbi:SDR family oxidoreductase [Robiginitalea sp. SC105]|uniref:SDR family oxidoreductase n=1 Tax=Robiginitalea sp. SC105 TaxID=2762332 RepID=UPI001639E634|nr:SDR family oxidoreductase [Robiginitalea sp. SC105]MBC2840703.1 SDR family oxidoreductase [Robiginitalea sp. SC105]